MTWLYKCKDLNCEVLIPEKWCPRGYRCTPRCKIYKCDGKYEIDEEEEITFIIED